MAESHTRGGAAGLLDSLARFGQSLLGALQTRLQLIADELEEQGALVARMAMLWFLAGICLLLALIVLSLLLVELFPHNRVAALSALLAVIVAIGVGAALRARAIGRARARVFSDVLSELSQDRASLSRRNGAP
jgi:uncharacterized membrane protein YqjE